MTGSALDQQCLYKEVVRGEGKGGGKTVADEIEQRTRGRA